MAPTLLAERRGHPPVARVIDGSPQSLFRARFFPLRLEVMRTVSSVAAGYGTRRSGQILSAINHIGDTGSARKFCCKDFLGWRLKSWLRLHACFTFHGIRSPDLTAIYRYLISLHRLNRNLPGVVWPNTSGYGSHSRVPSSTLPDISLLPTEFRTSTPSPVQAIECCLVCSVQTCTVFRARPAGIISTIEPSSLA